MRAVVFPSQGFETPGMGLARAEGHRGAARLLDIVADAVGVDARSVLARGGPAMRRQEVLQPLTLAVSLGSVLDIPADFVAGHSLGEMGAFVHAGALDADAALRFAAARGRIMGAASRERPGGIVAVRAMPSAIEAYLDEIPDLAVAARNTAESWSLCGPPAALAALATRTATTAVTNAGAWHHPSHAALVGEIAPLVAALPRAAPTARILSAHAPTDVDAADIPGLLLTQLSTPVDWFGVVDRMVAAGVREVVVAQPARHLAATIRTVAPALRVTAAP
jgi:[acyl-carrier-protein] S-malonyltransferase